MVNVSTNDSKISINVSSAGTKGVVEAQNDKSKYYEELAHEHEENAKASELLAKDWANKLGDTVDGVEYSAKHYAEEAEATLTEVESAKVQAIADIQEQEGSSISALNVEKGTILVDLSNAKDEILGDITEEGVAQVNIVTGTGTTAISNINSTKTTAISEVNTTKDGALSNISGALSSSLNSIDTAKVNAISDVVAESNTQKQQLQTYVNKASEYADNAKVSETNAHNSEIYCKEVIERIGTAIKIKGRVDLFENLPKTGNLDGDAYLVGLEGLESYPEYYWYQNHWEFLGTSGGGGAWGTITGDITAQTDLQNALDGKQPVGDYAQTNKTNTFTRAQIIQTDATKGFELYSQTSGGYLYVTRGGEIPVTMAIKSGASGGTFGTTTNHQFQFRTNDKSRMVIGVDGSVKLEQNVADTSNDNQVATTKWTNIKLSSKQDTITDLSTIRDGASKGATALQSIPIARENVVGGIAGGNWLTVNQTTGKIECGELTKAQYDSANGYTFVGKTTLENVLTGKGYAVSSDLATKQNKIFDISKFTVVGTPTITEDGIASGFSDSNYLTTSTDNNYIDLNKFNSWKIGVKFKKTSSTIAYQYIVDFSRDGGANVGIYVDNNTNSVACIAYDNSPNLIVSEATGSYQIQNNVWYYVTFEFTGNNYIGKISEDNSNWTTFVNIAQSTKCCTTNTDVSIGHQRLVPSRQLEGSIDLKQFSITVDGVEVFNGTLSDLNQFVKTSGNQTVAGVKTFTGTPVFQNDRYGAQLIVRRSNVAGASVVRFANSEKPNGMGDIGIMHSGANYRPYWQNETGSSLMALVRAGAPANPAVGSASQPVYINSDGVATAVTNKTWIGTLAQYNAIGTKDANTLYYITDDDNVNMTVYLKTAYVSGTSGYNIYSNGYCEQWGSGVNVNTGSSTLVNLLKTYRDTNYSVFSTSNGDYYGQGQANNSAIKTSNSSITLTNGSHINCPFSWETKGYLASGQY